MPSGDSSLDSPPLSDLPWKHQYRIVSSELPPINFFETLVEPELMLACGIDPVRRAETLSPDTFIRLANAACKSTLSP